MRTLASWLAIVAVVGGFLITWLPIAGRDWWVWVSLRVALQVGGLAVLGAMLAEPLVEWAWVSYGWRRRMGALRLRTAAAAALGGLVLAWAPVLDLAQGPLELERATMAHHVERFSFDQRPHRLDELCFGDAEHRVACIAPMAPKIWWVDAALPRCEEHETMDVSILRHLELVVGGACRPAREAPPLDPHDGSAEEDRAGHAWLFELDSLPEAVAARRAPVVALTTPTVIYTVVYGAGEDDRYVLPLVAETLRRREDVAAANLRHHLRTTYGVVE